MYSYVYKCQCPQYCCKCKYIHTILKMSTIQNIVSIQINLLAIMAWYCIADLENCAPPPKGFEKEWNTRNITLHSKDFFLRTHYQLLISTANSISKNYSVIFLVCTIRNFTYVFLIIIKVPWVDLVGLMLPLLNFKGPQVKING